MSFPFILNESDLLSIGCSCNNNGESVGKFGEDGTSFILSRKTCNVEYFILKAIIVGLGYEISQGEDFTWTEKKGKSDMLVRTTYPWEKYMLLNEAKLQETRSGKKIKTKKSKSSNSDS